MSNNYSFYSKPPPAPRSLGSISSAGTGTGTGTSSSVVPSSSGGWFTSSVKGTQSTPTTTGSNPTTTTTGTTGTTTSDNNTTGSLNNDHRSFSAPILPEMMHDRTTTGTGTVTGTGRDSGVTGGGGESILRPPSELGMTRTNNQGKQSSNDRTKPSSQQPQSQPPPRNNPTTTTTTTGTSVSSVSSQHPNTILQQRRIYAATRRYQQRREWWEYYDTTNNTHMTTHPNNWTHMATMCYRGMEICIAGGAGSSSRSSSQHHHHHPRSAARFAYLLCPRTHLVYQALPLFDLTLVVDTTNSTTTTSTTSTTTTTTADDPYLLSMQCHAVTGLICIALSNGTIVTLLPKSTNPSIHIHGSYYWTNGPIIQCHQVFTNWNVPHSNNHNNNNNTELCFDMSISYSNKVLVAYHNQLAIFEIVTTIPASNNNNNNTNTIITTIVDLIWMTQLSKCIRTAKISGDGNAIAVVLLQNDTKDENYYNDNATTAISHSNDDDDDDNDDAATDGIYTYEREIIDNNDEGVGNNNNNSNVSGCGGNGILYQPGPFLVHSAPVTHLSFRGYGNVSSSTTTSVHDPLQHGPYQSNDLLLSYCSNDCTVRMYGQNSWNPLTEWVTPVNTRVDFVQCVSSCTMGDFLNAHSHNDHPHQSSSSSNKNRALHLSPSSRGNGTVGDRVTATSQQQRPSNPIHDTYGKRIQFPTIPNHFPIPSTHAGAWIYEFTLPPTRSIQSSSNPQLPPTTPPPSLRISRLTYLERGIDDLNPTLLESISSYIPISSCFIGDANQQHLFNNVSSFSVQGIWPAWNPFLSTTATDTEQNDHPTDTIIGSTMESLGLSSGPSAGTTNLTGSMGYFGGHGSLGGTQCPPCEIRICTGHAISGQITLMDFEIAGDRDLTQVTLCNPRRNILSIAHMNERSPIVTTTRRCNEIVDRTNLSVSVQYPTVKSSMSYGTSRLIAEVQQSDPNSISVMLQKPGTMSFLPNNWLPDDIDPMRAISLLQNSSNHFSDESLLPVPLILPTMHISNTDTTGDQNDDGAHVYALLWWSDHKHGGSPLLLAILNNGTVTIFEIPPIHCTSELPMPDNGRPVPASMSIDLQGLSPSQSYENSVNGDENESQTSAHPTEFDVSVTPDPEFGLGLRLEAPPGGIGAFVGSFKRHPLSGDALPAEICGRIRIGDDLICASEIDLESKPFDDIVAAVREIGTSCGPGNPIRMKFHRSSIPKKKTPSVFTVVASHKSTDVHSVERRSMEQIIGVNPVAMRRKGKLSKIQHESEVAAEKKIKSLNQAPANIFAKVGVHRNVVTAVTDEASCFDVASKYRLVPLDRGVDSFELSGTRAAIMIWGDKNSVVASMFYVAPRESREVETESFPLGSHNIKCAAAAVSGSSICALDITEGTSNKCTIVVGLQCGEVHLATMSIATSSSIRDTSISFNSYQMFHLRTPWTLGSVVRIYSSALVATMQSNSGIDGSFDVIKVWSQSPTPGVKLNDVDPSDKITQAESNYFSSEICADFSSEKDFFCDFNFIRLGALDASPALLAFSSKQVTLFQKHGGCLDWIPYARIKYSSKFWEGSLSLAPIDRWPPMFLYTINSPIDNFPHLIHGMRSIYSSQDEKCFLLSDWHPVSLLATICGSTDGPKNALSGSIRSVLLWLCSESTTRPESHARGSIIVAPIALHVKKCDDLSAERPTDIMAALTTRAEENPDNSLLRKFLLAVRSAVVTTTANPNSTTANDNFSLNETDPSKSDVYSNLPLILLSMPVEDLCTLWVIGGIVLDPPTFDGLDNPAQLHLFSIALIERWRDFLKQVAPRTLKRRSMPAHGIVIRSNPSNNVVGPAVFESIPSSGTLAALLSNDQPLLLRASRTSSQRITWQFVRERRIAFWERSDNSLATLAEEIGSAIFLESRDVMESALFYIISKKVKTLQNLAKSDQSITGRTFAKFLTDYDFSNDRGRRAAEKNAFSLLRKCRYQAAAAFFLLASPPFLTSALETIATKMHDVDLAFFVARLTETSASMLGPPWSMPAAGSVFGGGGGYAAPGAEPDFSSFAKSNFSEWKPTLGIESRKLLIERVLPTAANDSIMTAVCLLWLGKSEEASWFVSHIVEVRYAGLTSYSSRNDASQPLFDTLRQCSRNGERLRPQQSWLLLMNAVIDFSSMSLLLKLLGASSRVRIASSLVVSNALSKLGSDMNSIRILRDFTDNGEATELDNNGGIGATPHLKSGPTSAIFNYDNALRNPNNVMPSEKSGAIMSSVFDSYSGPPTATLPLKPIAAEIPSSIFDDFEVQPSTFKAVARILDNAQSSIFDDFDVMPPSYHKNEVSSSNETDEMRSSIFDDYDVKSPTTQNKILNETTTSSVFDEFDDPRPVPNISSIAIEVTRKQLNTEHHMDILENLGGVQVSVNIPKLDPPKLWFEWGKDVLLESVSKRLLREIATVINQFHADIDQTSISDVYQKADYSGSSEILIVHCDYTSILGRIRQSLEDLTSLSELNSSDVIEHALTLLGSSHCQRILFSVLLYILIQRDDLAEDMLREYAARLMQVCHSFAILPDHSQQKQRSIGFISSLVSRRDAARISWQLESCLWLHRGGGLRLSNDGVKECIIAVRVGALAASWNRGFDCIDAMIFHDPDTMIDEDVGQQIWVSLKDINESDSLGDKVEPSEGWEFLVECKRSQASELLREAPSGCFLIRPHADDDGVYTLSFKTNLEPADLVDSSDDKVREEEMFTPDTSADEMSDFDNVDKPRRIKKKKVRKDDVVQHAIVRLSDSGFRCGSFGPFTSLMALLEMVSSSLPFQLRFDLPPKHRVFKGQKRLQTSPNAIFLRKLSLSKVLSPFAESPTGTKANELNYERDVSVLNDDLYDDNMSSAGSIQMSCFGIFSQLVMLSLLRRQLCSIAAGTIDESNTFDKDSGCTTVGAHDGTNGSRDDETDAKDIVAMASRVMHPFLTWCRVKQLVTAYELSPEELYVSSDLSKGLSAPDVVAEISDSVYVESVEAIEVSPVDGGSYIEGGDSVLRGMIRKESGIEFSTLRLVDAGGCTMLVLFSRQEAIRWLVSSGIDQTEVAAASRLDTMETLRVIERVDLTRLTLKFKNADPSIEDVRYRFVDPWEVEPLSSRDGESRTAALGRGRYIGFSLGQITSAAESTLRYLGGSTLTDFWSMTKGSALLTKCIAAAHPPWEKCCIGDLQLTNGKVTEPPPFVNSIRRCLFRNSLYRRLDLPQRFIAIIQVELLDLKNLTTPGGSLSLTAYALLRLKRIGSSGVLTNKARTIDSASTTPVKLNKTSGPNAPASWGSVVRFRFPLPDEAEGSGSSSSSSRSSSSHNNNNRDRETLFKGPPRALQISVYEKKLLADNALGSADVSVDGLSAGGQIEEWVPLRNEKHGTITWFTRIRISLRFDIMNLAPSNDTHSYIPSVGLQRVDELTRKSGGSIHEDSTTQQHHRSMSSSDLKGMIY